MVSYRFTKSFWIVFLFILGEALVHLIVMTAVPVFYEIFHSVFVDSVFEQPIKPMIPASKSNRYNPFSLSIPLPSNCYFLLNQIRLARIFSHSV